MVRMVNTNSTNDGEQNKKGSSEIWSDKVNLLHIKGTQRGGEHGGECTDNITEVPKAQRATES